jgi:hypothetical protein
MVGVPTGLISPLRQRHEPEVDKSAFQIDLEAETCQSPKRGFLTGLLGHRPDSRCSGTNLADKPR